MILKRNKKKRWDKKWRVVIINSNLSPSFYTEAKLNLSGFVEVSENFYIHPFDFPEKILRLKKKKPQDPIFECYLFDSFDQVYELLNKANGRAISNQITRPGSLIKKIFQNSLF